MHEDLAVRLAVEADASAGISEFIYKVVVIYGQRPGLSGGLVEDEDALGIYGEGQLFLGEVCD